MNYYAAIFDIVDSKKIEDRHFAQLVVKECIEYLNDLYKNEMKKQVVSGAGDEFQGLFKSAAAAFLYIRKLQLLLYPMKIRCGIGYGSLDFFEEEWRSTDHDGEAYHLAREAIESIPGKGSNLIFFNLKSEYDKYLNMYLMANADIKSKQSQITRLIELIVDVLSPISNSVKREQATENGGFYKKLLPLKEKLINEKHKSMYRGINIQNVIGLDLENFIRHSKKSTYLNKFSNRLYIDGFWERGLSTNISEILKTTRQNIDKHIGLGKIKESRNMDGTILMMLGEKI